MPRDVVAAVKDGELPQDWRWQQELTARGLRRADVVMVPTASHGDALIAVYGALDHLHVVAKCNGIAQRPRMRKATVRVCRRTLVGRGQERRHGGCCRGIVALAGASRRVRWKVPNVPSVALHHAQALGRLTPEAMRAQMSRAAIFFSPALV